MQLEDLGQTSFGAVSQMERMYASVDLLFSEYKLFNVNIFSKELNFITSQVYDKWGNVICHGDKSVIREGHKSFPSGHTSWSFAGLGFLSLYLSGKIKAFDRRGHVAKLCIVFLPLLVASLVGISRVDDYWHHWQDVFAGGLLGLVVATFCYLQFYPPPYDANGSGTYAYFRVIEESTANTTNTINAANLPNAMTGEIQIANQQEPTDNGFMGMHLARNSNSVLEDVESGKS
uniref:Phosphatidic acid phosphatase type 2/haloperoxidase domain-containing protein n=1 Tax=Gossypium raimondii TaxID=29730 RepID=A0A0D2PNW6_GOSRA|nr:hypothetical protein B456_001G084000 [Gossypium raimondii]